MPTNTEAMNRIEELVIDNYMSSTSEDTHTTPLMLWILYDITYQLQLLNDKLGITNDHLSEIETHLKNGTTQVTLKP